MNRTFHRDTVPSVVLLITGIYMLWKASSMTTFGAVFPTLAGGGIVLGGLALGSRAIMWQQDSQPPEGAVLRPLLLLTALLVWAILLPISGFVVTSMVAALVVMGLTQLEPLPARSYLVQGIALTAMVGLVAFVFQHLLNVPLP